MGWCLGSMGWLVGSIGWIQSKRCNAAAARPAQPCCHKLKGYASHCSTHGILPPSTFQLQSAAQEQFNIVLTITTLTACEQFKPADDNGAPAPAPSSRRMLKA